MFMDIDAYSVTLTGVQLGGGGIPPALFEIKKNVLIFKRKALIVFIFGLNFPFKM